MANASNNWLQYMASSNLPLAVSPIPETNVPVSGAAPTFYYLPGAMSNPANPIEIPKTGLPQPNSQQTLPTLGIPREQSHPLQGSTPTPKPLPTFIPGSIPLMPKTAAQAALPPVTAKLLNGSTGHFVQAPDQQQSLLTVLLPINSTMSGLQEFVSDAILAGSPNRKQYINQLSANGISVNMDMTGDYVALHLLANQGREGELAQVAKTLLTQPELDPWTFQIAKDIALQNYDKLLNLPDTAMEDTVFKVMAGPNHPYAQSVAEAKQIASQQTAASILAQYQQILQFPEQLTYFMVSPKPAAEQQQAVEPSLWYASPYRQGRLSTIPSIPQKKGVQPPVLSPNEKVERAHLLQLWQAPNISDPDYPAFVLLLRMMSGMTGGFFRVLRTEKGLVYSTSQDYGAQKEYANFSVSAEVDFDKITQAMSGIQQVVNETVMSPATPSELTKVKKQYILGLRDNLQSSEGIGARMLSKVSQGMAPESLDSMIQKIEAVTAEDIQRMARRVFDPTQGYSVFGVTAPKAILDQYFPNQPKLA